MTASNRLVNRPAAIALLLAGLLSGPASAQLEVDVCGCAGSPESFGDFDSANADSYPPGTPPPIGPTLTLPLPDDGIMIFDSFVLDRLPDGNAATLKFARNAANTPVQILVAGDITVATGAVIDISGSRGQDPSGSGVTPGAEQLGGPGGYRGGAGASFASSGNPAGGSGLGPGGGAAQTGRVSGAIGRWMGAEGLSPLTGGSGGAGGSSDVPGPSSCGSGGGGGGAILLAADGTVSVEGNIVATGGRGANYSFFNGNMPGGAGSGGAVRIVASKIAGNGSVEATGGAAGQALNSSNTVGPGGPGRIRFEALINTFPIASANANPTALRFAAPGPIAFPSGPTVAISQVDGAAVPQPPLGWQDQAATAFPGTNAIDILVQAPGLIGVEVVTSSVPEGTLIDVSAKPSNGTPLLESVEILPANCDASGTCTAFANLDLGSGFYALEAQATFLTPTP